MTSRTTATTMAFVLAACGPALAPPDLPRATAQAGVSAAAPVLLLPGARRPGRSRGAARGAVHIYQRDAATGAWALARTLELADGRDGDQFGSSVALSGDALLVGALGREDVVFDTGAAPMAGPRPRGSRLRT